MEDRTNKEWAEEQYAPENDTRRQRAEKLIVDKANALLVNANILRQLKEKKETEDRELQRNQQNPQNATVTETQKFRVTAEKPADLSTCVRLINQDYDGKELIENLLQRGNTLYVSNINVHRASELLVKLNNAGTKEIIPPETLEGLNDRYLMTAIVNGHTVSHVVNKDTFERVSRMNENQRFNEFRQVYGVAENQSTRVENVKFNSTGAVVNAVNTKQEESESLPNQMRVGALFEMYSKENQEQAVSRGIGI